MGRKGQITIFIILGLILIITLALTIYFITTEAGKPWKTAPKVPEDIRPVFDMVNDCTKAALKQGLLIQGLQGGYIDIPAFVTNNPDSYLNADPFSVVKIPYWYYETENRIPSYGLMQQHLGKYVKEQILECVNFNSFVPQYVVNPLDNPEVAITFARQGVAAEVKWPLKILTPKREVVQNDFFAVLDLRYREMYEMAVKVLEEENKQEFLEKLTIDLMSADSKIPMGGMETGCRQKRWNIETVQKRLKDILFYTIPMIRIKNTPQLEPLASQRVYDKLKSEGKKIKEKLIEGDDDVEIPEDIPQDTYEINKMTFDVNIPKTDLKMTFVYDTSKLLLSALPHDGKWLKSSVAKGSKQLIPFFCMNQWHFTYDIIYPVKVVIKDEESFNGEGFVFQFTTPVIINDNAPERINFGMRKFDPMYIGTGFCEDLGDREVLINVLGFEPYSIVAIEQEDVNITLECMNIECEAGKTKVQPTGDIYLKTRIPQGCGNPKVVARKKGYLEKSSWLTNDEVNLFMKRLVSFKPEFIVHPYQGVLKEWQTSQNRFRLGENEKIMFSLKLKNSDYEQYKIFPEDEDMNFVLDNVEYELEIYLLKNDVLIGGFKDENLVINYEDLLGKERVQFNLIEYRPNPSRDKDFVNMMNFLDIGRYVGQKSYQKVLKPLFT